MDAESVTPSEWKPVEIGGGLILIAAVALHLAGVAPFSAASTGMTFLSAIIVTLFGAKALAKQGVSALAVAGDSRQNRENCARP